MASKTVKPSNVTKITDTKKFNPETITFGPIITTDKGSKWVNSEDSGKKFLMVAKNCKSITFKLEENGKYSLYMSLTDNDFIKAFQKYDESLIESGVKNSKEWFNDEMTEQECKEMYKTKLSFKDKYGYSISCNLSKEFNCKSKTEDVPDTKDLFVALQKHNILDVCFNFTKVNLGVGKYSIGFEITQINVIGTGSSSQYKSNAITVEEFLPGKITLSEKEVLDKGAKKCKVLYGEGESSKPLRLKFENIKARMFLNKQPGEEKESYSLSIRLSDAQIRKTIETIDEEIFKILLDKSKDYYDAKKTSKMLRPMVKSLLSYNKADQEKIKKGEKPSYEPSLWIKIYHSEEKGFDGKITNFEGKKPLNNTGELVGKDLNITSLEIYSKHIWFGPKGTSINFTLNNCEISFDVPVYDMDNIDEDNDDDDNDKELVICSDIEDEDKAVNSDNEDEEVKVASKTLSKLKITKK